METIIVNIRNEKCDVKICRLPNNTIPDPPKNGCFGNPFFLKNINDNEEREEVLKKYRKYFYERIEKDEEFRKAILTLKGKKLGCFCAPKLCHGNVIKEYLDNKENICV